MPGVSLLPRIAVLGFSLLAFPVLTLSSAAGNATWADLALGAYTRLGNVRISAKTSGVPRDLKLTELRIELDGRRIPLPRNVDVFVPLPRLSELGIAHTASVTCIGDCPDISRWPVTVVLPFGERIEGDLRDEPRDDPRDEDTDEPERCEYSLLRIEFVASGIDGIQIWECRADTGDFDERRLFPADGEANTRR